MHPVADQVEIPIEKVEHELEKRAIPGFTGSVTVYLRLRPLVGSSVYLESIETEHIRVGRLATSGSLNPQSNRGPSERVLKVRQQLRQQKDRFRVRTTVTKVIANYVDGDLRDLVFESGSEQWM